jgi:hypothetical protein
VKQELTDRIEDLRFPEGGTSRARERLACGKFLGPKEWVLFELAALKKSTAHLKPQAWVQVSHGR